MCVLGEGEGVNEVGDLQAEVEIQTKDGVSLQKTCSDCTTVVNGFRLKFEGFGFLALNSEINLLH